MTANDIRLAKARLTASWRKVRWERCKRLHDDAGGALASGEDTEEAEYLYRLAELDVKEAELDAKTV
jgi:hypothetical protein